MCEEAERGGKKEDRGVKGGKRKEDLTMIKTAETICAQIPFEKFSPLTT